MDAVTLIKYKCWADRLLYESLSQLPEVELQQDRPMLFRSILALLNHLYVMDVVWSHNLNGSAHNMTTRSPQYTPPFSSLRENQHTINEWYQEYVVSLSLAEYEKSVEFAFIGGGSGTMRRSEMLHHVVNHGAYHRGHIEGVMYQMGVEPPTTDLPVFLTS